MAQEKKPNKSNTDVDQAVARDMQAVRAPKGPGTTSATTPSALPGEGGPLHGTAREKTRAGSTPGKSRSRGPVGSDAEAAKHFADAQDFGIPAADAGKRMDASVEAKSQPEGSHQHDQSPTRSSSEGTRTSGVGGNASGAGSSSGGDVDTDIVGVGTGGSTFSSSGPDDRTTGPDMTDGTTTSRGAVIPHAAGIEPAHGAKPDHGMVKPEDMKLKGTTVDRSGGDVSTTGPGLGSGTTSVGFDTGDDASAGEISQGEASGDDNA